MKQNMTRRNFLATAGTAALAASATSALAVEAGDTGKALKILGVSCSPRKGMTTAKAVQAALDAAKARRDEFFPKASVHGGESAHPDRAC